MEEYLELISKLDHLEVYYDESEKTHGFNRVDESFRLTVRV